MKKMHLGLDEINRILIDAAEKSSQIHRLDFSRGILRSRIRRAILRAQRRPHFFEPVMAGGSK